MLSSKSVRRMFVCLLLLLPAITGISAAGQSSSPLCAPTAHAVVLYAPESNLERREIETLRTAKVSVDVAMYSFTDRELAEELVRLARSGVRVRVYRDSRESMQENQRGSSTTWSANWSPTGLKRQDNDVHYEVDTTLAALFETRFEAMWDRATNQMATPPRSGKGCRVYAIACAPSMNHIR